MLRSDTARGAVPGEVLAERYEIERILGQGAYGRVFLARDRATGEAVALKEFIRERGRPDSFVREVGILFELRHPAVLACHTLLVLDSFRYIVCEYLDGGSLRDLLASPEHDPRQALALLRQAATGVAAAHERGVVHRDLKPENILLYRAPGGLAAKVSDFGISVLGAGGDEACLGSPAYMAPEQFQERHDARVDIYALGVMLHEICCGRRPYEGSPAFLMSCHLQGELEAPAWLPRPLWRVIARAMARRPERRFASVGALTAALDGALDRECLEALAEGWPRSLTGIESVAVGESEALVMQAGACLRLSTQGRLIERVEQATAAVAAGRFHAVQRQDGSVVARGPSLRRTLRAVPGPVALSTEGALAFVIDGQAIHLDRSGRHARLRSPGVAVAVAFVGPDQLPAVAGHDDRGPFVELDGQRHSLPEPVVSLHGHGGRPELIARSALDPARLLLLGAGAVVPLLLPSGVISCDGENFFCLTPDGTLATINIPRLRVARTRWPRPLAAVGAGSGRLLWATIDGELGVEHEAGALPI